MESELFKMASSQGVWAALFVALFIYTLKDAKTREAKYQEIVAKLSGIIENTLKDLAEKVEDFVGKKKG